MDAKDLPEPLRRWFLRYLKLTSTDRALLIAEFHETAPGFAEVLIDLEADHDLRTNLEVELLRDRYRGASLPRHQPACAAWGRCAD